MELLLDQKSAKKQYRATRIQRLEEIYRGASFAPLLKRNPKYCVGQLSDITPYISFADITNNRFIIRGSPFASCKHSDTGKREIIIQYTTLAELINDGWQID